MFTYIFNLINSLRSKERFELHVFIIILPLYSQVQPSYLFTIMLKFYRPLLNLLFRADFFIVVLKQLLQGILWCCSYNMRSLSVLISDFKSYTFAHI